MVATGGAPSRTPGAEVLLERDSELAEAAALLRRSMTGEGGLLIVHGSPGIGKTAFVRSLCRTAKADGVTVLAAAGADLEREFAYGVACQLFQPVLRTAAGRARLLTGAAGLAAAALRLPVEDRAQPGTGGDAESASNHGLYWLTANLADEGPLLLAVDDAHWADLASLHFVDHLLRRIEDMPVLVVLATREDGLAPELVHALRSRGRTHELRLQVLSEPAVGELAGLLLGNPTGADLRRACHNVTGGNPFLLTELLRAVAARGLAPDSAVAAIRVLGPRSVSHAVLARIVSVGPDAVALARALAVLDSAPLRHCARLADLDPGAAAAAADALAAEHVLLPGARLRFLHPIMRTAVYEDLAEHRRAADHARAARILDAEALGPEATAAHLLLAEPAGDPWVVDRLHEAASGALVRGAPPSAVAFLRRALREPPEPSRRAALLLQLGQSLALVGDSEALDVLAEAVALADGSAARVEAADRLAAALMLGGDMDRAVTLLEDTADAIPETDREARYRVEGALLALSANSESHAGRIALRLDRLNLDLTGETLGERMLLAGAAWHGLVGTSSSAKRLLVLARRAGAGHRIATDHTTGSVYWIGAMASFLAADRDDLATDLIDAAEARAQRSGSATGLAIAWAMRARLAQVRGDLPVVEDCVRTARELYAGFSPAMQDWLTALLALALLWQGRADEAAEELDAFDSADLLPMASSRMLLVARARTRARRGDADGALRDAREAARRAAERGACYLVMGADWSTALALWEAGDPEGALAEAERELSCVARFGHPSVTGIGALVSGTVRPSTAVEQFGRAVDLLAPSPRRLDFARSLVEFGAALRRSNRRQDARDPLRRGMALAHDCTATTLVDRAHQELLACGARPRRLQVTGTSALTVTERRIAQLAASGLTNAQIAQAQFITRKTVETHLGRAYRKLGITVREELAAALESD